MRHDPVCRLLLCQLNFRLNIISAFVLYLFDHWSQSWRWLFKNCSIKEQDYFTNTSKIKLKRKIKNIVYWLIMKSSIVKNYIPNRNKKPCFNFFQSYAISLLFYLAVLTRKITFGQISNSVQIVQMNKTVPPTKNSKYQQLDLPAGSYPSFYDTHLSPSRKQSQPYRTGRRKTFLARRFVLSQPVDPLAPCLFVLFSFFNCAHHAPVNYTMDSYGSKFKRLSGAF